MSGAVNYAAAMVLLAKADEAIGKAVVVGPIMLAEFAFAAAQVHATLAVAAATGCQLDNQALREAWLDVTS